MPTVGLKSLKGNYAENWVATWLSQMCLVRPSPAGTDIGVDLYCESTIGNTPFLHFWVQVKAVSRISKAGFASYSFRQDHLKYWRRQPIPVYAFLVPVPKWPPESPSNIHIISLSRHLHQRNFAIKPKQSIRADQISQSDIFDLDHFVSQTVPWDTAFMQLRNGIVAPIPNLPDGDTTENSFPQIPQQSLKKILTNIRDTAIVAGLWSKDGVTQDKFAKIVSSFEDELSAPGIQLLVASTRRQGNDTRVKEIVSMARERVQSNSQLDDQKKSQFLATLDEIDAGNALTLADMR